MALAHKWIVTLLVKRDRDRRWITFPVVKVDAESRAAAVAVAKAQADDAGYDQMRVVRAQIND